MSERSEQSPAQKSWPVVGIFLIMFISGLAFSRDFVLPVLLALLLALVFRPVRTGLNRVGIPHALAAFAITGTLLVGLFSSAYVLSGPVERWIEDAPRIMARVERKIDALRDSVDAVAEAADRIDEMARRAESGSSDSTPRLEVEAQESSSIVTKVLTTTPVIVGQLMFTLVLLYFLLASGDLFYRRVVQITPNFRDKRRAMQIATDIERRLSRYLSTITLINALLGISVGVMAWLIGLPDPILFGLMAFGFNFIPYVGAIAGTVITFLIGFISFDQVSFAFLGAGLYFMLTSIEGQLVTPLAVGRSLKLNPVVVFLSVAFWAWLWSVVGMIIAVPVLVVLRVFCEHIPALENLGQFLISADQGAIRDAEAEEREFRV
ncbi:AI-2E family transporter [Pontivivens insulae]|uniref:AI-2 transport protein TqsA n=1 Tax=Pontivivens insulae TaxID=1639689 RepID=A0A2R8ABW3_9RHOB|nr:AI-2E family transporter [Pontivivens insulae]RED11111.1 putative PurR-regulated permease PerM [Pontivivens insulae]SPF29714.1 AI-2 transport protein TqsA [Pontivivens insulae]